jgi:hypothetical protein
VPGVKFEKESFGTALRAGRERRKIPLAKIVEETKTNPELWKALEENDFSKWPTRIYARNLIRQYAEQVGLDPEELVNEFCRLFPQGDRRADGLLREQAGLIGHRLVWREELTPNERNRRSDATDEPAARGLLFRMRAGWLAAAALDLSIVVAVSGIMAAVFGIDGWRTLSVCALAYYTAAVARTGRTGGALISEWLIRRAIFVQPIGQLLEQLQNRKAELAD